VQNKPESSEEMINENALNNIDQFLQHFYTTKPTGQGTGLGLFLSYDIMKAHGWELEIQSQPDSTVFKIYLIL
jgi:two-component system, NtrC family, sensor kinase